MGVQHTEGWTRANIRKQVYYFFKVLPCCVLFIVTCLVFWIVPEVTTLAQNSIAHARSLILQPTKARLIVMTMDRAVSVKRLLDSVARARYGRDRVDIDIWVDIKRNESPNKEVLRIVHGFEWRYGRKTVFVRSSPGGLYAQWLDTWDVEAAIKGGEFAVFLEDDLELSPAFYEWLVEARRRYGSDRNVAGFTLQRLNLRPRPQKANNHTLSLPRGTPVFKFRLHGSWGFAPLPTVWSDFLGWYREMRRQHKKPYVDNLITTSWYRAQENKTLGYAPTMWTQWMIYYSDVHRLFTVTPRLLDGTTLAANWKEPGLHFRGKGAGRKDFKVFQGSAEDFVWPKNLLEVDWDGSVISLADAS